MNRSRVKVCRFCEEKTSRIEYKEVRLLQRFVTERGKIIPRRMSGTCARHQRSLTRSIKRARQIALLPFASESMR
jgi:small subunit ribosomal protein S18